MVDDYAAFVTGKEPRMPQGSETAVSPAIHHGPASVEVAIRRMSEAGSEARGAVFTRREVVEFILDLVGYTANRPLYRLSLLEPSFGAGDFLLVAVERLLASWYRERNIVPVRDLGCCIRAVELHHGTFQSTRAKLAKVLEAADIDCGIATALTDEWLIHGDFLLSDLPAEFDVVVGNPPYVRHELIPDALISEYRTRYTTVFDRADLYVPFIERSARQLAPTGKIGIICADRWVKNRYGGPLRRLLRERFHIDIYVDMVDTPAFHSEVIAYPAIFVISREGSGPTRVARRPKITSTALTALADELVGDRPPIPGAAVANVPDLAVGNEPWIMDASGRHLLVRRLECQFPRIEDVGCRVGIGVATGADKAFIGDYETLDVEEDRKLPLVTTQDIVTGEVRWRGQGVINPFSDSGTLVDLGHYPRLSRYLESRRDDIAGRHVARKAPANWYRTIDRIHPALTTTPKLLIPDIKGDAHIVYEEGRLYPHHNLYYVTAQEWDLLALAAVLRSGIAKLFVAAYSTRMRGGYLRFQAQYLRRIRLPHWPDVPPALRTVLVETSRSTDRRACHQVVGKLYGLDAGEQAMLVEAE
ncbi:MAG: Eco57I restriction-modification methylase domain-containing protein [bacterium]|nr:Eco57I restriction-modification methylase domain-containing protein [bacterium]